MVLSTSAISEIARPKRGRAIPASDETCRRAHAFLIPRQFWREPSRAAGDVLAARAAASNLSRYALIRVSLFAGWASISAVSGIEETVLRTAKPGPGSQPCRKIPINPLLKALLLRQSHQALPGRAHEGFQSQAFQPQKTRHPENLGATPPGGAPSKGRCLIRR